MGKPHISNIAFAGREIPEGIGVFNRLSVPKGLLTPGIDVHKALVLIAAYSLYPEALGKMRNIVWRDTLNNDVKGLSRRVERA